MIPLYSVAAFHYTPDGFPVLLCPTVGIIRNNTRIGPLISDISQRSPLRLPVLELFQKTIIQLEPLTYNKHDSYSLADNKIYTNNRRERRKNTLIDSTQTLFQSMLFTLQRAPQASTLKREQHTKNAS
jgi:hypothetical protein